MTELLQKKIHNNFTRIHTLSNWADTDNIYFQPKETNEQILKYRLESKIVFSYAGSIGRCQGIVKLLDLIGNLEYNDNIHFLFFGKGVALNSFTEQISKNKNQKLITYAGFIITEDKKYFINACDIAIISLLDGMIGLNFPSKTYNIMASGHPILFLGKPDSEIAKMIISYDIGWVCSFSDLKMFQQIVNKILIRPDMIRMKGIKARKIAEDYFAKEKILNQYVEVLKI
jgi:glycosyltransferase involved in cell wall biosynthesis